MKHSILSLTFTLILALLFVSCSPKVKTTITQKYPALAPGVEVIVFGLDEIFPDDAEELGSIKIGDTGFTTDCAWDAVIEQAKAAARKAGGNALKVTAHKPPTTLGSSCHRIEATVLRISNPLLYKEEVTIDTVLRNAGVALIHFYRYGGPGMIISYNVNLGDSVITRMTNKSKATIRVKRMGPSILWAQTEAKVTAAINIEPGREYFVRCGITMGAFVGHPRLTVVEPTAGRVEFDALKVEGSNDDESNYDHILLNDGKTIECVIQREDEKNVFFTMKRNNKPVDTRISRSRIKSIERRTK